MRGTRRQERAAHGWSLARAASGSTDRTAPCVVHTLCAILDELSPRADGKPYKEQITYVQDRPGHDRRYAINATKIERELGWDAYAPRLGQTIEVES